LGINFNEREENKERECKREQRLSTEQSRMRTLELEARTRKKLNGEQQNKLTNPKREQEWNLTVSAGDI
jgi:hypothetical protein